MANARRLVGGSLIFLALCLGFSLLTDISAAKPEESSSGVSENEAERQQYLVEPALTQALEAYKAFETSRVGTVGLVLPSGLPEGLPQQTNPEETVNLANEINMNEEINILIDLYAAKHHVDAQTLRWLAEHESTYNPNATGLMKERGVCQFLESTWQSTPQARFGWESAYSPAVNIEACAWMLSQVRDSEFTSLANR